jgi:hypothetical protein
MKTPQDIEVWLKELSKDTYDGLDVKREYSKMCRWCEVHGKQPTKRRFIAWLNRIDPILKPWKPKKVYGHNYLPEIHETTDEERRVYMQKARAETAKLRLQLNR